MAIGCLFILYALHHNKASADYYNLYSNCVKGYEFTDTPVDAIVLTPLNYICQKRCKKECGAFSRTVKMSDDPYNKGMELNDDVIQACMPVCQSGMLFQSGYFEAKPRSDFSMPVVKELRAPVQTGVACSGTKEQIANNIARTRFVVKDGDQIKISITGLDEDSSKIYLCGKKSVTLEPIFPNMKATPFNLRNPDWDRNIGPQDAWSSKNNHICFSGMSDADFSNLTNKNIWDAKNGKTICDWHARNPNYVSTGIYMADGDEIAISWTGEYVIDKIGSVDASREELINCLRNPSVSSAAKAICQDKFTKASSIVIKDPKQVSFNFLDETNHRIPIFGEDARATNSIIGTTSPDAAPSNYKVLNLTGTVMDEGLVTEFHTVRGCDSNKQEDYSKPECILITKFGRSKYSFYGTIDGFSKIRSELALKHYEDLGRPLLSYMTNHFGGYNVEINWGGCPFKDGERMQYTIFAETDKNFLNQTYENIPDIPDSEWIDLPEEMLEPDGVLKITNNPTPGTLFLRIKPLVAHPGDSIAIKELYEDPKNYHGQYYVLVEQLESSDVIVKNGVIVNLVKAITNIILGDGRQIGTVTNHGVIFGIYNNVVGNPKFVRLINVFVIMYIAFVGIGFALGIIKANHQELIYRLLKIGAVLAVIAPSSWSFFGGYLVPLCIDGTTELIAHVMSGAYPLEESGLNSQLLLQDPYLVFEMFDGPLKIMFSSVVWKKIVAVLFDGLIGIILCVIIIVSIGIYLVTIVKVMVIYLISIIVMSLLIVSMPIILPFILFQNTKQIFDQWAKHLISFMLQPVFCFAAIALFNFLIIMVIKIILNFTACPTCFLYINLAPLYEDCWIPSYTGIFNTHAPDSGGSSGMGRIAWQASTGLALLILVHSSYIFSTYMALVAATIATGSPIRTATAEGAAAKGQKIAVGTTKWTVNTTSNKIRTMASAGDEKNIS